MSAATGPLPPEFWSWDVEQRTDWMTHAEHRRGLITKLLLEAGLDPGQIDRTHYLTEKELAAIHCRILELKRGR